MSKLIRDKPTGFTHSKKSSLWTPVQNIDFKEPELVALKQKRYECVRTCLAMITNTSPSTGTVEKIENTYLAGYHTKRIFRVVPADYPKEI